MVISAAGVAAGAAPAAGEMVRLVVRDHGNGVPQERLADLFGRFSGTDTGKVGLGLWIVRELVRAHGGEVSYQPADPGACFVVTLPAADARVADAAGADERPAGQSQLRERFLS